MRVPVDCQAKIGVAKYLLDDFGSQTRTDHFGGCRMAAGMRRYALYATRGHEGPE